MSDITCGYPDREATLMAYLYDEITPEDRAAFDTHLTTCARCRVELNGLGGVRTQLAHWAPPDYRSTGGHQSPAGSPRVLTIEPRATSEQRVASDVRWAIPAWVQYAAAVLVLGVSIGAANFNIHYDAQNGLNIRTGWSNRAERAPQPAPAVAPDAVSRAELTALEQQLRSEIQATAASSSPARNVSLTDSDAQRRFKTLLDENERRHEREMALRIAEVVREVNAQRQADLVKIDQNLGLIDRRNDIEIRKNRQLIDLMQRVSRPQ